MSLEVDRIRAVCFDLDGTLSDSDDYYTDRIAAWLRYLPFISDWEGGARRLVMWLEAPGNSLLQLADKLGIDDEIVGLIERIRRLRRNASRLVPAIPGVVKVVQELHERYLLAVVSSRDEISTIRFLEQAGLMRHFDAIITARSAEHSKPYPDPIRAAAMKLGIPPESCVMVGDTTPDIRAGKAAGAQTVGVLCGYGEEAELRREGADLILQSTADLGRALLTRRQAR